MENDYARLWPFFTNMAATMATQPADSWLTEAVKDQYRTIWNQGLNGALNYYRASPLKPPLSPTDAVMQLTFTPEFVTVNLPTLVIWGEADTALPPALLDGLEPFVPQMHLVRVSGASHWIVHEQPSLVAAEIEQFLTRC